MHSSQRLRPVYLWLLLGSLAAVTCSLIWPTAHLGNEHLPVTNDSFYHARRILDTAADPSSFYEFDAKIHAPEGSLLPWPWGYDYAMGWLVRLAGMAGVPGPPIAFLIWIPVAAVFVSMGLLLLIARRLALSQWATVIAGLCFALSPLTESLHGVGMIDHHFAEFIMVLSTIAAGLKWLANPSDRRAAIALGVVLGIAPAINNGLFILQIPIVVSLIIFWLQGIRLPPQATKYFCAALLLATIAILVPSLPVRLGRFEFFTLSWFHLYLASGTAVTVLLLCYLPKTWRSAGVMAVAAILMLLPIAQQILMAQTFLAGTINRLYAIAEMKSVSEMAALPGGIKRVSTLYSLLVWLVPLTFVLCLHRGWAERKTARVYFWIFSICGLMLLVTQFRLHYFGSYALYIPWLVLLDGFVVDKGRERRRQFMLGASLGFLLMYSAPIRYFILDPPSAPAGDTNFRALRPLLDTLQEACDKNPGLVLADNDAGHYIRYYTRCSVIANNFLLTRQHEEKIAYIDYLTSLSATELTLEAPDIRYILVRPVSIWRTPDNKLTYMTYSRDSSQLLSDLLLRPIEDVPHPYILLNQASMTDLQAHKAIPWMRLYLITPGASSKTSPFGSVE